MVSWQNIAIVQVGKQRVEGVLNVERRIVQGAKDMVVGLIGKTQGQGMINTAFIERLNATFRQRISPLMRRTRNLAQQAETWVAGMYIVGCFYNFCDYQYFTKGEQIPKLSPKTGCGRSPHPVFGFLLAIS